MFEAMAELDQALSLDESDAGQGSDFRFTLPLVPKLEAAEAGV